MTLEEQDLILGRLVRERKEAEATLAACQAKIKEHGSRLSGAGSMLQNLVHPNAEAMKISTVEECRKYAAAVPTTAGINDALSELDAAKARLVELNDRLKGFGV